MFVLRDPTYAILADVGLRGNWNGARQEMISDQIMCYFALLCRAVGYTVFRRERHATEAIYLLNLRCTFTLGGSHDSVSWPNRLN